MLTLRYREDMLAFRVLDWERLVTAAVCVSEAQHFAANGGTLLRKWFHPAARTREEPIFDPPIDEDQLSNTDIVGCRLDSVARESVRGFLVKASTRPPWIGACLHHWWIYSDERQLVTAYDWGMDPVQVDCSLAAWAEGLQRDGVLGDRVEIVGGKVVPACT